PAIASVPAKPALAVPETQAIPVAVSPPLVAVEAPIITKQVEVIHAEAKVEKTPIKRSETFLAGPVGAERGGFMYRCKSDGSVRETVVYFYGDDLRAAQASGFDPLRREAVYQGRADASRLHAARKLSDTLYVGDLGHERRDQRREYRGDGEVSQTVV